METHFEKYRNELQYLAIEHLCVGHTYRLLNYPEATNKILKTLLSLWKSILENTGIKSKYVKSVGVSKKVKLSISIPILCCPRLFEISEIWRNNKTL